jgi:hypothetical protein
MVKTYIFVNDALAYKCIKANVMEEICFFNGYSDRL